MIPLDFTERDKVDLINYQNCDGTVSVIPRYAVNFRLGIEKYSSDMGIKILKKVQKVIADPDYGSKKAEKDSKELLSLITCGIESVLIDLEKRGWLTYQNS